jgi:enoyl-CoA hydratase/carnithine racemase
MSFENLLLERDGALAVLTINRPHGLNALNPSTADRSGRVVPDLWHAAVKSR